MSGPWEKYQSAPEADPAAETGPWTQYLGDTDTQTAAITAQGSKGSALPNALEAIKGRTLELRDKVAPPGDPINAPRCPWGSDTDSNSSASDIAQRKANVA